MVKTIIFLVEHLDYIVSSNDPMFPKYGKHHWEFAKFTYLGMQLGQQNDRILMISYLTFLLLLVPMADSN